MANVVYAGVRSCISGMRLNQLIARAKAEKCAPSLISRVRARLMPGRNEEANLQADLYSQLGK